MTLLQTRVNDKTASQFRAVASQRNMSPYELLCWLVEQTASAEPAGWAEHCERMSANPRPPLAKNAMVTAREGEDR